MGFETQFLKCLFSSIGYDGTSNEILFLFFDFFKGCQAKEVTKLCIFTVTAI